MEKIIHDNEYIQILGKDTMSSIVANYADAHPESIEVKQNIISITLMFQMLQMQTKAPVREAIQQIVKISFFAGLRFAKLHPEKLEFKEKL